ACGDYYICGFQLDSYTPTYLLLKTRSLSSRCFSCHIVHNIYDRHHSRPSHRHHRIRCHQSNACSVASGGRCLSITLKNLPPLLVTAALLPKFNNSLSFQTIPTICFTVFIVRCSDTYLFYLLG